MDLSCPHCGTEYDIEKKDMYRYTKCSVCSKGFVAGADSSLLTSKPSSSSEYVAKPGQRDSRDSVVECVSLFDRSHDIRCVRSNRVKCAIGAPSDIGRRRCLALERHRPCSSFNYKVHLCARRRAVERDVCIWKQSSCIGKHNLFPAGAKRGMGVDFIERLEAKEGACHPSVAEIDFWGLHKPFAEIGHEWRDYIHHECLFEKVDVPSDGHVGYAKRRRKARVVDHLGVFVRKHLPKPPHRLRHKVVPEQHVPFKKCLDERLVPFIRFVVVSGEICARESTAEKALRPVGVRELGKQERSEPFIADSTGQRFGALSDEVARGGAKDEKVSVVAPLVAKASYDRKQFAFALYFVNADKFPLVAGKEEFGGGELGQIGRLLEVKIYGWSHLFAEMLHQCGLSALAWTEHGNYRISFKRAPHARFESSSYVCFHEFVSLADSTFGVEISRINIPYCLTAVNGREVNFSCGCGAPLFFSAPKRRHPVT